jgi:hypothetical protein
MTCLGDSRRLQARATGAYPKYLLSGIVRCGVCGSNLVVSGPRHAYVYASRVNGGVHACANKLRLPRVRLEKQLQPAAIGES